MGVLREKSTKLSTFPQALTLRGKPVVSRFLGHYDRAVHTRFGSPDRPHGAVLRRIASRDIHMLVHRCGQHGNRSQKPPGALTGGGTDRYTWASLSARCPAAASRPSVGFGGTGPSGSAAFADPPKAHEREAHLPTPQPPPQAGPWIPRADEHEERPQGLGRAPQKGPSPPDGLAVRWYDRLRRSSEIAFVRRRGKLARGEALAAYAAPQASGRSKVAVTVSAAVGGAVVRNRVRRRIRGALDARPPLPAPMRILFVAKPGAAALPYAAVARAVRSALDRLSGP